MAASSTPTTRRRPSACMVAGAWHGRSPDRRGMRPPVSRMDTLQAAILDYRLDQAARRDRQAAGQCCSVRGGLLRHERLCDAPPCRNEEFNTFHTFVVQVDRRDELQQQYLREHLTSRRRSSARSRFTSSKRRVIATTSRAISPRPSARSRENSDAASGYLPESGGRGGCRRRSLDVSRTLIA